jgi:hypothetical protein
LVTEKEKAILSSPDRVRVHEQITAVRELGYLVTVERETLLAYAYAVIEASERADKAASESEENRRQKDLAREADVNEALDAEIEDEEQGREITLAERRQEYELKKQRREAAHHAARLKRIQEKGERIETNRPKNPDRGYRGEFAIGSTWYTDGATSVRVKNGELPPTGFVKGRSSILR